jgi:hypothetical protein
MQLNLSRKRLLKDNIQASCNAERNSFDFFIQISFLEVCPERLFAYRKK